MTGPRMSLVSLGLLASVAACDGSSTPVAPTEPSAMQAAPFHEVPADAVVVSGAATCDLSSSEGVDPDGGGPGWLVVCQLDMSDPRVSGTERHDRLRFFDAGDVGDVWVAEEASITNAEGTWRGVAQAADDGKPSGEAHYVGEGAYEGLEFHSYFGGSDTAEEVTVRGWVFSSDG